MSGVCRIHGAEFDSAVIEIRRGMPPAPPEGYLEAEQTIFPNAKTFEVGGCVISLDDKYSRRVRYCPACREAKAEWMSNHSDPYEYWD